MLISTHHLLSPHCPLLLPLIEDLARIHPDRILLMQDQALFALSVSCCPKPLHMLSQRVKRGALLTALIWIVVPNRECLVAEDLAATAFSLRSAASSCESWSEEACE